MSGTRTCCMCTYLAATLSGMSRRGTRVPTRLYLVGGDVGVEPHRRHLAHGEIELFAGDLQKPGGVALTELALAEINRRGVVGVNRDPSVDLLRIGRPRDAATHRRGGGRRYGFTGETEADDQCAAGFQYATPAQRGAALIRRIQEPKNLASGVPPAIVRAAS